MKTLVINAFASPGSGKSTLCSGLFYELKSAGVNVELTFETAKQFCWEERNIAIENQIYVFAKQQHQINRLLGKVDVIITDSPLLLTCVYAGTRYPSCLKELAKWSFAQNDNLNFLVTREKPYNPAGRYQTEEESDDLQHVIRNLLDEDKHSYQVIPGNRLGLHAAFEHTMEIIQSRKKFEYETLVTI